jgi:hypothetical protein
MTIMARTLWYMLFTFLSLNVVAFCRLVISARRGWRHVPGLSRMGAAAAFEGVDTTLVAVVDGAIVIVPRW